MISYGRLLEEAVAVGGFGLNSGITRYRSVVFYHTPRQQAEAQAAGILELEAADVFTRAEDYLQKHYLQHGPEGQEFLGRYASFKAFADSTEAARANAIASGRLSHDEILSLLPELDVSPVTRRLLLEHARK